MKGIYNIRTLFEKYYSEYGNYIDAAAKFVTALILFMQINGRIGGKSIFGNIFVELILALVCAILPPNVMIVLAFVAALLQFASVSIASLAVGGGVLLAVLLLYFAFASRQAWAMLLTILGLFFHVPCIVPISFGLMGSTMSAAGMAAGTVFYYTLLTIGKLGGASVDLAMAKQSTAEKILAELQTMIDTLLGEQEMILMLVVLLAVFACISGKKDGDEACMESCDRSGYGHLSGADDGRLHDAASGDRDFMDPDRNIDLGGSGISAGTVVF